MLGVPPAFVLSQDQTLYLSCISTAFRLVDILFISIARNLLVFFSLFFDFLFYSISYSGISRVVVLFLHCSIFKMLCAALCKSRLIQYIILLSRCQVLFSIFSNLFCTCPSLSDSFIIISPFCTFVNSYFLTNIC